MLSIKARFRPGKGNWMEISLSSFSCSGGISMNGKPPEGWEKICHHLESGLDMFPFLFSIDWISRAPISAMVAARRKKQFCHYGNGKKSSVWTPWSLKRSRKERFDMTSLTLFQKLKNVRLSSSPAPLKCTPHHTRHLWCCSHFYPRFILLLYFRKDSPINNCVKKFFTKIKIQKSKLENIRDSTSDWRKRECHTDLIWISFFWKTFETGNKPKNAIELSKK